MYNKPDTTMESIDVNKMNEDQQVEHTNSKIPTAKNLQSVKHKKLPDLGKRFKSHMRPRHEKIIITELPNHQKQSSRELKKREVGFDNNFNSQNYQLDKKKIKKAKKDKTPRILSNSKSIDPKSKSPHMS